MTADTFPENDEAKAILLPRSNIAKKFTAYAFAATAFFLNFDHRLAHDNTVRIWLAAPMTLGGFEEDNRLSDTWHETQRNTATNQSDYESEKKYIRSVLKYCAQSHPQCPQRVKEFGDMVDFVRTIPDHSMQLLLVNAWVNIAIKYDYEELKENKWRRTLVGALKASAGVCDEISSLKMAALEMLGFPSEDIRWVRELIYVNGKRDKMDHAVIEVRLGNENLILEDREYLPKQVSEKDFPALINYASRLEQEDVHLNHNGESNLRPEFIKFYPWVSFSGDSIQIYKGIERGDEPVKKPVMTHPSNKTTTSDGPFPPVLEMKDEPSLSLEDKFKENPNLRAKVTALFYPLLARRYSNSLVVPNP